MADARGESEFTTGDSGTPVPDCASNDDRNLSEVVASDGTVQVSVTKVASGVSSATAPPPEDDRKKRCLDRYDSSESSDSGVAVLSSAESGGCSGSELTEPGSPCSPASSTGSGEDCGGGARVPPWSRQPSSPVPTPTPHQARKRHATASAPTPPPSPAAQGTITQYFSLKMKTHNGLKRDHAAWSRNDDAKKRCTQKAAVAQDIEKYISLLSHTLNPKVLLEVPKDPLIEKTASENSYSNTFVRNATRPKIVPVYTEQVDVGKPAEAQVNGATYGSNNFLLNNDCKKPAGKKEPYRRGGNVKKVNCKEPTTRKTTWFRLEGGVTKPCANRRPPEKAIGATLASLPVDKSSVNFADTAPKITMANSGNGMRTIPITFNGAINSLQQLPMVSAPNCSQINIAPHGTVTTSTNLAPFMTVPQVMLTTLRIPQNASQPHTLNPPNGLNSINGISGMNGINGMNGLNSMNGINGMNGFARQNVNINVNTSPTKLNGQFVFPLVQNINGTVVQIPNLMTKVGHNFVIPHSTQLQPQIQPQMQPQMQPQRPDNTMQQGQMLINGTLLKLTSSMAPTYSTIMTKPTTTTNISYPMVNKALNTAQPTVMTAKPHFTTLNVGSHSVLMPQPGYFINPVPNNTSKDSFLNFGAHSQVNTSCAFTTVQSSPIIQSDTPCYQVSHTSSIPIPPVKPPDKDRETEEPPEIVSPPREPKVTVHKKAVSCNYPNLTKLLNSSNPLPPQMLSRPFAQVSKSTEKMLDITPAVEDKVKCDKESLLLEEEVKDDMSPVSTPENDETVFTEITVMKQVSSDIQSTILETTFSCVTNESSESGIGTDKSLGSPSDSRTSKDCDDDSSLSLSVSVCSVEVQPCQKSPILKQPKTLRFPPKSAEQKLSEQRTKGRRGAPSSVTTCRWENCRENFASDTDLLEHLQVLHVNGQAGRENYVCLWTGCKVRGKPSCSRLWLERHALSHAGTKPFKCIVDDCDRRFSTQMLLERHVNNHFNEQSPNVNGAKKAADSGPKLIRRNGKVLRYRRQPWSARMFDFFDGGMMEGLAWRLARTTCWRAASARPSPPPAHSLTLVASLAGTRFNAATDTREALVTYMPKHVLEDEWIPEKDVRRTRSVDMSKLPTHTKVLLYEQFCDSYRTLPALADVQEPPSDASPPPKTSESSRMLNNLIAKQRKTDLPNGIKKLNGFAHVPTEREPSKRESTRREEVSGAAKRKQGRRHGGNAFWPCGR